jgi:hypothetical protein
MEMDTMAHDIYISYSSKDKSVADALCANLESAGLRCWMAPRDIMPGDDWPTAISMAISHSRIMVLVFSSNANSSDQVSREILLAANNKLVIIPFKIDNIEPEPGKQYYLARTHWIDALNPPTQSQIDVLINSVRALVAPSLATEMAPPLTELSHKSTVPSDLPPHRKSNWFRSLISFLSGDPSTDAPPPDDTKTKK